MQRVRGDAKSLHFQTTCTTTTKSPSLQADKQLTACQPGESQVSSALHSPNNDSFQKFELRPFLQITTPNKKTHTKSTPTLSPSCSSSFPPLLLSSRCCHAGCVLPTDLDSSAVASVILTPPGCVHFARFLHLTSADARKAFDPIRHLTSRSFSLVLKKSPWFFVGIPDWICDGWNR
jgi:hypothetical protein